VQIQCQLHSRRSTPPGESWHSGSPT
jgi:hypothetical protein